MTKQDKTIYYAQRQVINHSAYVWGGQGQKLRKVTVEKLAEMETSASNVAVVMQYIYAHLKEFNAKTKIFDCSGLVICALIYAGLLKKGYDTTADGLMHLYPKVTAAQAGDLVFKVDSTGHAYHVGILQDAQTVIECKGRSYGVVYSKYGSKWNAAVRPNY